MTITQFLLEVRRTAQRTHQDDIQLAVWSVALEGEWGELCNLIKKVAAHGHELDPQRIADELGDVVWYIVAILDVVGSIPVEWSETAITSAVANRNQTEQRLLWCGITSVHIKRFLQTVEHPVVRSYRHYSESVHVNSTPSHEARLLMARIFALGELFGLSRDTILETVVTKLRKRYPHGFTQQASRERVV